MNTEFLAPLGLLWLQRLLDMQSVIQRLIDCGPPVARSDLPGFRREEITSKSAVIQMVFVVGDSLLTSRVSATGSARLMAWIEFGVLTMRFFCDAGGLISKISICLN